MNATSTVFYLAPLRGNGIALKIIKDPANNGRKCVVPNIDRGQSQGLDWTSHLKVHRTSLRFGRRKKNDVILNLHCSRNDQCYFDFNKDTGELLLHDISEKNDTDLYEIVAGEHGHPKAGNSQIWKTSAIRDTEFLLIPQETLDNQHEAVFAERRAFAGQPDPDRTMPRIMQKFAILGLESQLLKTTYPPQARTIKYDDDLFMTLLEPKEDDVIRYAKLGRLGDGGQGQVYKVVDKYIRAYYACKPVAVKVMPQWNINSVTELREKVEAEVNLVRGLHHAHLVPYVHAQGSKIEPNIEIFMPVYKGNFYDLLERLKREGRKMVRGKIIMILNHILNALDFVHTRNPQIIHRDIKPANILYRDDMLILSDFGIATVVDTSMTVLGTEAFMAPEVRKKKTQTLEVDIWGGGLGATAVDYLGGFPSKPKEELTKDGWDEWDKRLQDRSSELEPFLAPMLIINTKRRPPSLVRHHFHRQGYENEHHAEGRRHEGSV